MRLPRLLPWCLAALGFLGVASLQGARDARAEAVRDAGTRVTFTAPDGWTVMNTTARRGTLTLYLRRSPDDKATCGLAVGRIAGTLDAMLEAVESVWKAGPESYARTGRSDDVIGGLPALRQTHRITYPGHALVATTVVVANGNVRAALWFSHEEGLEAAYADLARTTLASLVVPAEAARPPAGPPSPPAPPVPPPTPPRNSSPVAQGPGLMFDPRFREGSPSDVLVATGSPLLRGTVDAFVDLVEASVDAALPADEEQALRDGIETAWPRLTADDRQWLERCVDRKTPATVATPRAAPTRRLLRRSSACVGPPTAAWKSVVRRALADRATPFTTTGTPPVSIAAASAFEALGSFLVCVARNDGEQVTEGQAQAVRARLRSAMDASGALVRGHYARLPRLWLLVKARGTRRRRRQDATRGAAVKAFRRTPAWPSSVRCPTRPSSLRASPAQSSLFDLYGALATSTSSARLRVRPRPGTEHVSADRSPCDSACPA
jgi:hypothetical protein